MQALKLLIEDTEEGTEDIEEGKEIEFKAEMLSNFELYQAMNQG